MPETRNGGSIKKPGMEQKNIGNRCHGKTAGTVMHNMIDLSTSKAREKENRGEFPTRSQYFDRSL